MKRLKHTPTGATLSTGPLPETPDTIAIGQWYWFSPIEDDAWLGCVVHLGSNYALLKGPHHAHRVHFSEFWNVCRFEHAPNAVIDGEVATHKRNVEALLGEVRQLTSQLAIAPNPLLGSAGEAQALAVRGANQPDMGAYSDALTKAKQETLPNLFRQIRTANEAMATWMTAKLIPLQAQAGDLRVLTDSINERIFSVQLYAGLVEEVERVRDGVPAMLTERIHVMQRRHYMDEECLANYETGGMEFKNLGEFDRWLARPDNFERILPFPRTVVAFRVRRHDKEREDPVDIGQYFIFREREKLDRVTFIYIRNGEQLFRLNTAIEFGEQLFPDMDREQLSGKLWARITGSTVESIITEHDLFARRKEHAERLREWKRKRKVYVAALKSPEALAMAKEKDLDEPDWTCVVHLGIGEPSRPWWSGKDDYHPFDQTSVFFDDILAKVQGEMREHNRIALVLQGLLDRSPVLHPHPPWQLWSEEGFRMALELVYDQSRALVAGEKPDFEAYRAQLNAQLKVGSITIGQQDRWMRHEAVKEGERRERDWRDRSKWRPKHWVPQGNDGPGMLARVIAHTRTGKCTFAWNRKRQTHPGYGEPIRTTFDCNEKYLLNVDAYQRGDFKRFFQDPRTRAEYLEWAPLMLEAEEFHAGNRKIIEPPLPEGKKPSSREGRQRYARSKQIQSLLGKAVRLLHKITMRGGGTVYPKGSLWRVVRRGTAGLDIQGAHPDGSADPDRYIMGVRPDELQLDPAIPPRPQKQVPDEDEDAATVE